LEISHNPIPRTKCLVVHSCSYWEACPRTSFNAYQTYYGFIFLESFGRIL